MSTRFKLGCLPSPKDPRTPRFSGYLGKAALPDTPTKFGWDQAKLNQIYLNDTLGICTIAGISHGIDVWQVGEGKSEVTVPDSSLLTAYEACGHYNPNHPLVRDPVTGEMVNPTDRGCNELAVLKYVRKTGLLGPDGKPFKIKAFTSVNPVHSANWNCANWLMGGTYLGIVIPAFVEEWMRGPMPDWVWPSKFGKHDLDPMGGHAIWQVAYDSTVEDNNPAGAIVSTWGMKVKASRLFLQKLTQEVWAVLGWDKTPDPLHFDLKTLEQDLQLVGV